MARPKKYVTCETFDSKDSKHYETVEGKSETILGDTFTIQELFERYTKQGIDPSLIREGFWDDTEDFDLPDFSKLHTLDITERYAIYEEIEGQAQIARAKIEDFEKAQAEKEKTKAELLEAFEKDGKEFEEWYKTKKDKPVSDNLNESS